MALRGWGRLPELTCALAPHLSTSIPAHKHRDTDAHAVEQAEGEAAVDRTLVSGAAERLLALQGWKGLDNPWLPELDADVEFSYINLLVNPERYTGYTVRPCQHKFWHACARCPQPATPSHSSPQSLARR